MYCLRCLEVALLKVIGQRWSFMTLHMKTCWLSWNTSTLLTSLCELYLKNEVDSTTSESLPLADIDVISLLLTTQLHNANQLCAWCLHFISSNYTAFSSKPEFSLLTGNNLSYIQAHQWPPVSYLEAMEEYRKKYKVDESEDPLAIGGRGRSSERCSLM
ncbi:hypothetical protein EMCRGX_G013663 [Ephydatia muelleri]